MVDDVARYYTRGVRFPRLVGKTDDGTRIPGGPYTITQVIGGLVVFVAGNALRPLWGGHSLVADYAVLLVATVATVFALKFVRSGGRDPFTAGLALLSVYAQPRSGRVAGRAVRIRTPHRVSGRIALLSIVPSPAATPAAVPRPVVATGPPRAPARRPAPSARRASSAELRGWIIMGVALVAVVALVIFGVWAIATAPQPATGRTSSLAPRHGPVALSKRLSTPPPIPTPAAVGQMRSS